MWSGGAAYVSVHKVHQQVLSQLDPGSPVETWLLQGEGIPDSSVFGPCREWQLSSAALKGRGLARLMRPWLQGRFLRALQKSNAHVVLLDGIGAARFLLPVIRKLPEIRAVVLFHGQTRFRRADHALFARFPASQLQLAAVSRTLAVSLQTNLQAPAMTLRTALEPEAFLAAAVTREQAREILGVPSDVGPVFGAVGRLVADKGFGCLLEAFSRLSVRYPEARLWIIGEGAERTSLEARIAQFGLGDRVCLPGHIDDAARLFKAFDWLVVPSRAEGLGLIVQEAVLARVPVLLSDLEVFREQLGDAARYVSVDDPSAWAEAMSKAIGQSGLQVANEQSVVLDPQGSWRQFRQGVRALLSTGK
ncbi:glycosyltransferase [Pseudomonas vanderleydeniana]|uniref:Glycosyltransferase n=2 Tax=Pseudomonas vanderleydeniana TaxID=2745495 RepID=A0A9E6PRJ4_9PSED|nr:glycosyltransferase [Pseudomonas vanderleydeniana]